MKNNEPCHTPKSNNNNNMNFFFLILNLFFCSLFVFLCFLRYQTQFLYVSSNYTALCMSNQRPTQNTLASTPPPPPPPQAPPSLPLLLSTNTNRNYKTTTNIKNPHLAKPKEYTHQSLHQHQHIPQNLCTHTNLYQPFLKST